MQCLQSAPLDFERTRVSVRFPFVPQVAFFGCLLQAASSAFHNIAYKYV